MADGRNYGQRDIVDVKEGVEHLIDQGVVDPDAVGVTGCSYGGYFTLQSMVEFPDFYAAGNTQCSLNDVIYEYNFGWAYFLGYLMGRTTIEDPMEYVRDSPYYRAHQIEKPLLVFHGTNDFLPHEHMVNIHDQVENNGVATRMLRAFGEGHGFGRSGSQKYGAQLQIDWFRRYLFGESTTDGSLIWRDQPRLPRSLSLVEVDR
jgi:dipeptidyl aminopeptidase/acylaminoacyl peptidase